MSSAVPRIPPHPSGLLSLPVLVGLSLLKSHCSLHCSPCDHLHEVDSIAVSEPAHQLSCPARVPAWNIMHRFQQSPNSSLRLTSPPALGQAILFSLPRVFDLSTDTGVITSGVSEGFPDFLGPLLAPSLHLCRTWASHQWYSSHNKGWFHIFPSTLADNSQVLDAASLWPEGSSEKASVSPKQQVASRSDEAVYDPLHTAFLQPLCLRLPELGWQKGLARCWGSIVPGSRPWVSRPALPGT